MVPLRRRLHACASCLQALGRWLSLDFKHPLLLGWAVSVRGSSVGAHLVLLLTQVLNRVLFALKVLLGLVVRRVGSWVMLGLACCRDSLTLSVLS